MNGTFHFKKESYVGIVSCVNINRTFISIKNKENISRYSVGNIIAIINQDKDSYFMCLIDNISANGICDLIIIGTFYKNLNNEVNVYKKGANKYPSLGSQAFIVEDENIVVLMELINGKINTKDKLKIGQFALESKADALLNGDFFFQRHAAILGSTGSGKSWCIANIVEKASKLKFANIVIFDIHGEYKPLSEGANPIAKRYKIAGPSDHKGENENIMYLPYWLLTLEEMSYMLMDQTRSDWDLQETRLITHIERLKDKALVDANREDIRETYTVDSPIPYDIKELLNLLHTDNSRKSYSSATGATKLGIWENRLTNLVTNLRSKISDKRFGFLFNPPESTMEFDWLDEFMANLVGTSDNDQTIKIIDFSEVPGEILPIITGKLVDLIYKVQFWMSDENNPPINIVCDEAHLYLPENKGNKTLTSSLKYFEKIAKEGRKYGVSLTVASQRPQDVSKTILSQCNNFIVLRLTNDNDKSTIKSLLPTSFNAFTDFLPILGVGECMVFGDAILIPSKVLLDVPKIKPGRRTRNYWQDWDKIKPTNDNIKNAVNNLRKQTK